MIDPVMQALLRKLLNELESVAKTIKILKAVQMNQDEAPWAIDDLQAELEKLLMAPLEMS
jgi:hypothetical protein